MSNKKMFLIMLIMLILITMGGAWASDDHASDELAAADGEIIAADSADDTQQGASVVKENLTIEKNDEAVQTVDSDSNQKGEILSASNDEDVLGAAYGDGGTLTDLDYSIENANENDNTLILRSNYYGETASITSIKNTQLTIKSQDATNKIIIRGSTNHLFTVAIGNTKTLIFENLIFKDGLNGVSNDIGGGAFYLKTGKLEFINCEFENFKGTVGGAFYAKDAGSIKFTNCSFKNCNSTSATSGAIFCQNTDLTIINCTFERCNSKTYGGAIYSSRSLTKITNTTFTKNTAGTTAQTSYAAAVLIATPNSGSYVENCTFRNNNATGAHGALAISSSSDGFTVSNCKFINNHALGGRGGAMSVYSSPNANFIIENCRFENNSASDADRGGGALALNSIKSLRIIDSEFINNHMVGEEYGGGAISFNSTTKGSTTSTTLDYLLIYNTVFKDNYAVSGGAIFIYQPTTNINITSCNFTNNYATSNDDSFGGGAIYIPDGVSGIVIDECNFTNNNATNANGGAVFFKGHSDNINILNSYFESNRATTGGAVQFYADNYEFYHNVTVKNSTFTSNLVENGGYYGGSALCFNRATNVDIIDCNFTGNKANYGTVFFDYGDDITIDGCKFIKNNATIAAAGVYYNRVNTDVSSDANSTFNNCVFDENIAVMETESNYQAGVIYLRGSNHIFTDNTFKNNRNDKNGGVIFANSTASVTFNNKNKFIDNQALNGGALYLADSTGITINDAVFENNVAQEDGGAIYFKNTAGEVSNTAISGNDAILIDSGSTVTLTRNNNTANSGDYSVENNGTLSLSKNIFANVIINNGLITSSTNTTVLDNDTVDADLDDNATLYAKIVDDNNNIIILPTLEFIVNATTHCSLDSKDNTYHYGKYLTTDSGEYVVTVSTDKLGANTVNTGVLNVKIPKTEIEFNVTQEKEGEIVTITATIKPPLGKTTTGTLVVTLYDMDNNVIQKQTQAAGDSIVATFKFNNLTPDTYKVKGVYTATDSKFNTEGSDAFVVKMRDVNMSVAVKNIANGQNATAVINVTAANGTVTLVINGRDEKEVEVSRGINEIDLGQLAPGNYTLSAYYAENDYYKFQRNSTTFEVYAYDMIVDVSDAQFNQTSTITVTLPSDATGEVEIYLNGVKLEGVTGPVDGVYTVETPVFSEVGDKTLNVTYKGNDKYYARNYTDTLTVNPNSAYDFNVEVTPQPVDFGKNMTINITGPAGLEVNVTIDGVNQTVTLDANGEYVITLNNLTAGPHSIVANTTANGNYSSKGVSESFIISPATPELTIDVTKPISPNAQANVTVTVGPNATGTVAVYIDGKLYDSVDVDENGKAVIPIGDTSVPGTYNVTVRYVPGENDNYKASSNMAGENYTVDRYESTVTSSVSVAKDNHVTVTVTVDGASDDSNVTFTLSNSTVITENIVDGVATFDLGVIDQKGYYNFTAVYNGDEKFNANSTTGDFTIGNLNNGTMDITIIPDPAEFGDDVKVIIDAPGITDGIITVKVNGTDHEAVKQADGKYVAVFTDLPVGVHDVNVTCVGDSNYNDFNASTTYEVKTNSSYEFNVEITPQPVDYGDNLTITVTGPAGENVTVYVDGVPYTLTINETGVATKVLDNLTAGTHNVTANITGNDNYTSKEITKYFTIDQKAPSMEIIVPDEIAPGSDANITVVIGDNATGNAIIYINGVPNEVPVIDGVATLPIDTNKTGTFNVTAKYFGDRNYTGGVNDTVKQYTVNRFDVGMNFTVEKDDSNNVTFVIQFNQTDVDGNVTIKVGEEDITAEVVNGVARVNVGVLTKENNPNEFTAVYSGDVRYNGRELDVNATVGKLNNGTMNIEVVPSPAEFGDAVNVIIDAPGITNGTITVNINGDEYSAELVDGKYVALIPADMPVDIYDVNVTCVGDSNYNDFNASTTYEVKADSTYDFNVTVAPAPFGNDTVITVSGPAGLKVNVTVDDEVYELTIDDGTVELTLNNLTAGKHDVSIVSEANDNYTANANSTQFTVPKQKPAMDITVSEGRIPNENVTVTVKVGDNATNFVTVTVDGKVYENVEVKDGVAQVNITGLQPNDHTITVQYVGDDNYNASEVKSIPIHMDKYNTTMTYDVVFDDNNNATVVVTVNSTAKGNVTIVTPDGVEHIGFVENGVARVNIGIMDVQDTPYKFTANYNGEANFNPNSTTVTFEAPKLENATVKVEVIPGEFGDNTTIKVTVPKDGDGNVTIYVDGKPTVVVPDENGVAILNVTPGVGPHEINVTYTNDTKYADKESNGTEFTVAPDSHYGFNVTVEPADPKYGDAVTITVNAPEGVHEVNVTIDDEVVTVTIDETGKGTYTIANLTAGKHTVIASFNGNENYTAINNSTTFAIGQTIPGLEVTVNPTAEAGSDVTVDVTIDKNATGTVNLIVDGKVYDSAQINEGKATFTITDTQPGKHNITVKYLGDANYTEASKNATFTTDVFETSMEIIGTEIDENNDVTVLVKVNGTGNVTIKVGEETYNATVGPDGIAHVNIGVQPKGNPEINVTYTGDDNFALISEVTNIEVPALRNYTMPVTSKPIDYGEVAQVNVTLPEGASVDNLKFYVDGVENTNYTVVDGKVQLNVAGLKAGNHTVTVKYAEDDFYADNENSTTFNVATVQPKVKEIIVNEPIDVGDTLNITVKLPEDAKGTVTVDVNGTKYVVNVVNGEANITIPKLDNGTYNVTVTYSGDDNYDAFTEEYSAKVEKVDPEITATTSEIKLGEDAVINVTLPGDATGTVTVKVGDIEKTFAVTGGENLLNIPGIPVGDNQLVTVTYNGNDKYAVDTTTTTLTVKPQDSKSDEFKVEDKGNGTIIVTVPENATGNITLKIGNETYEVPIEDGKAVIDIANRTNQTPGVHDVTISYTGDGNNTPVEFNSTANVPKWESEVNVNIPTIREGDIAKVNVTVTSKDNRGYVPNGTVRVEVDGKGYYGELVNGNVIIDVLGLDNGTHTVKVIYDGNDYYLPDSAEETVKVQEAITVKVNGTGNSSEIVVQLPEDATQNQVEVFIDGKNETGRLTVGDNGTAKVNLTGIEPGVHNVTIKYTDEDGTVSYVNTTITVPKWSSSVNATAAKIREGDPAIIKVKVSPDMTGEVKVEIGGTGYIATVDENGEATITAYGLKNGTHTGVVTYLGDNRYDSSNATFEVTVQEPITVKVNGTGNSSEVVVKFPEGTDKDKVNVTIDGKDANDRVTIDKDGTAKVNLTGIEPGEHNITIKYTDEDGTVSWVNTTVNVPKWSSSVNATAATIREGDPAIIKVKVSPDMTGEVKVVINGTGYIATVDENGEATITAYGLKNGTHTGVVTYLGDNRYDPSNATFEVTVQEPITVKVNGTGNSSEIVVQLPKGANETSITITVDGNKTLPVTVDENGTARANLTGLEPGEHEVSVKYVDPDGTVSYVNTTVTVPRWSSAVNATAAKIREGDVAVINVKMDANETGRVLVDINGTGYYADLKDGKAIINAPGLKAGTYNATVTYEGDAKYDPSNNTFTIVVQAPITIDVNGTGNSSEVVVKLPEGATDKDVNITVDGNKTLPVTVDENGTARANLTGLEPGEHNITVKYVDPDGTVSYVNTTINVPRWSSAVNATAATIREGDDAVIKVKVDSNETGTVYVDIAGTGYYGTLENGEVTIYAPGIKKGKYTGNVTYLGDKKYDPANNTFTLEVQSEITIDLEGAGNSSKVVVQLPEDSEGSNVTVMVDGKEVPVSVDENGTATADLSGLPVGEHNVTVIYKDKDNNTSIASKTVKVYNSINVADEIIRGWNSPYDAEAEFLDKEGHVLANTTVEFTVNGKTYKVKTDEKGIAKLTDSHLDVGKYEATIKNPVTGEELTRNVTIVKRLIENKDVTTDYLAGKYYTVKAIGDDGKPVGAGEVIGITVNGVGYVIKTNKDGVGKLKINLVPKKYTIIAEYAKYKVTNKIVVKQTLKLVKKTVKAKKGKKIVIKAKLKWTNGKAIKGKKITIKFKGKKFSAKTNKKGIAKITIKKKSVLKKLKKGKTYKFTALYVKEKAKGKIKIK